jgi:hypothetical protein
MLGLYKEAAISKYPLIRLGVIRAKESRGWKLKLYIVVC